MPDNCPHCGAPLPFVVDAYCPECREELDESPPGPGHESRVPAPAATGQAEPLSPLAAMTLFGSGFGGVCVAIGAAIEREWFWAVVGGLLGVAAMYVALSANNGPGRTTRTGREKTRKST